MRCLILVIFFLTSCASYVQSMHQRMSYADKRQAQKKINPRQKKFYDPYGAYRGIPLAKVDAKPIQNPRTLGGPQLYQTKPGVKRYTASDLRDNSDDGSLWNSNNSDSFLFVPNSLKRKGDVVIVDVMKSFKEKITQELKRAFPERKVAAKSKDDKKDDAKEEEKPAPTTAASKESNDIIYDKISTIVIDEVNKDYLVIRGRKEVLFKNQKRFVEVSGLISRKVINDGDSVKSNEMIEPKIVALRYKK